MSKLITILKTLLISRFGSMAAGLLLALLLVWFAGPYVGLKSVSLRLIIIAICLFLFFVYVFFKWVMDKRRGKRLEQDIEDAAMLGTNVGHEADIENLRKQMHDAITSLRASELGSARSGSAALYALPWYMIIGPSAAGKSTILRNSGLNFPYSNHDPRGIQGIGGTRNCDWWFSDQAIFLDTAGRYTTEDEDREEWIAFLDMLRKNRSKQPVNGILVAVSIADLLTCDSEAVEQHAKVIRDRIDELIGRLGLLFPVYVIFTKCDLVRGFGSFFEDLGEEDREQVWGSSMLALEQKNNVEPGESFAKAFQALYSRLCTHRLHKLGLERNVTRKAQIVDFPNQFHSASARLEEFIQQVFKTNPYSETPIFSGFYFTSGAQEGAPIERVVGSLVEAFGTAESVPDDEAASEQKPFFIHRLLKDVVLPNSRQAIRNRKMAFRTRWLKRATIMTSIAVMVVSLMGFSASFASKMLLISDVQKSSERLTKTLVNPDSDLQDILKRLVSYYNVTSELWSEDEKKVSLYKPSGFEEPLAKNFLVGMETMFLMPVALALETSMEVYVQDVKLRNKNLNGAKPVVTAKKSRRTARAYEALKLYLYLTTPEVVDDDSMAETFARVWIGTLKAQGLRLDEIDTDQLNSMASYYIRHMKVPAGNPLHARAWNLDNKLITKVRAAIREVPSAERYYADMRDIGSRKYESIDLINLLGGHPQGMLVGKHTIPGIFTKKAWQEFVWPYIKKSKESSSSTDWVMGAQDEIEEDEGQAREMLVRQLRELYFADYAEEWFALLGNISARRFDSLRDASSQLQQVAKADGPITALFKSIKENIEIIDPDGSFISLSKGEDSKPGVGLELVPELKVHFKYLQRMANSGLSGKEGSWLPIYLKSLEAIQEDIARLATSSDVARDTRQFAAKIMDGDTESEMYRSWLTINHWLEDLDTRTAQALASILRAPIKNVWGTMTVVAQRDIQNIWKNQVRLTFNESLSSRYPFTRDGRDASMGDLVEFFKPRSGVFWSFINKDLRPFIEKQGNEWQPRKWLGIGLAFEPDFLKVISHTARVTNSFFSSDDAQPKLSFAVYPFPNTQLSESTINVDGSTYRYRNGPQEWRKFDWPGSSPGARIQGIRAGSVTRGEISAEGTWAWLRLLDKAKKRGSSSGTSFLASWSIRDNAGQRISVRFRIRPDRHNNPFKKNILRGYHLPGTVFPKTEIADALDIENKNPG